MTTTEQVGPYRIERTLGEGSYGQVKLAWHVQQPSQQVAVKVIEKERIRTAPQMERLKREVRMLKLLSHPHIVQLYDVVEAERVIYLTMEVAKGGEVFDYVVAHGRLREKEARRLFRQIVSAVAYCHANFIVHRDIKPENLLLDADRNVKIIDFGLCNFYTPDKHLKTFCGSAFYAAPEMITGTAYVGPEVDIWSLGIVLFVFLCGTLPFNDDHQPRLFDKILSGVFHCPDDISLGSRDLLSRMIVVNPSQRLNIEEVRAHPWVVADLGEVPVYLRERPHPTIPDDRILQQLPAYGCNVEKVVSDLQDGVFNSETAVYHLLVERAQVDHERQLRQMGDRPPDARPTLANRSILSSRTSQTLPPPFDPTAASAVTDMSQRLLHQQQETAAAAATAQAHAAAQAHIQLMRLRNSRRTVAGSAENEMAAARMRYLNAAAASGAAPNFPAEPQQQPQHHALAAAQQQAMMQALAAQRMAMPVSPSPGGFVTIPQQQDGMTTDQSPSPSTLAERQASFEQVDRARRFRSLDPGYMEQLARRATQQFGSQALQPLQTPPPEEPYSAGPPGSGPRIVNGLFNVTTSSSRPPAEIEEEVRRVLTQLNINFTVEGFMFQCRWQDQDKQVAFTIEICRIATLPLFGLHLNRIAGEPWIYKAICDELSTQLKL